MASITKFIGNMLRKGASSPDWGTLERYMAWAFGGGASSSGIVVNPQTAMQSAAVYSSIKVLAESIAMLPLNLYKKAANGSRTCMEDHPLHVLLHDQPNSWQTSVEFWEMMVVSLNLRGNAYAYINRVGGKVLEILPLHPDMVRVDMKDGWELSYQITMPDGTFQNLTPGQVFHIRGLTLNGWIGISPINYAKESIGLSLATEKFGSQLFRNGAKMSGVLEHPGKLSKESYERVKSSFDEATSGENAHKTALLEEGMKYAKISMTADESQFLATRKYQRSEIAAIFRVPPHMIGDLEKATFSNIEQQSIEFVSYSLMPWLVRIEKAIKRDLMTPSERKTLHAKFNVSGLLRGDAAARGLFYHNMILDGWGTRNEARAMESEMGVVFNPIDGLDLPLMPLNMTDGQDDPDENQDEAEGEKPGAGKEPSKEQEDAKKALILRNDDMLERVVKGIGTAISDAIAAQPTPQITNSIVLPDTPITVNNIERDRTVTKTVVTQRLDDGTLIATVKEE